MLGQFVCFVERFLHLKPYTSLVWFFLSLYLSDCYFLRQWDSIFVISYSMIGGVMICDKSSDNFSEPRVFLNSGLGGWRVSSWPIVVSVWDVWQVIVVWISPVHYFGEIVCTQDYLKFLIREFIVFFSVNQPSYNCLVIFEIILFPLPVACVPSGGFLFVAR